MAPKAPTPGRISASDSFNIFDSDEIFTSVPIL